MPWATSLGDCVAEMIAGRSSPALTSIRCRSVASSMVPLAFSRDWWRCGAYLSRQGSRGDRWKWWLYAKRRGAVSRPTTGAHAACWARSRQMSWSGYGMTRARLSPRPCVLLAWHLSGTARPCVRTWMCLSNCILSKAVCSLMSGSTWGLYKPLPACSTSGSPSGDERITRAPPRWTCGAMHSRERHRWRSRSPGWLSRKGGPP